MVLSRLTKITGPGVATDTNWVGNNADFTGITTTATSFNIGVTTFHSTLAEVHNIKSTGIITATGGSFSGNVTATGGSFSGNVTAVDGTFSGNVSIAGTLTYEDVTNIDAVGIITAPALDVDDFLDVGSNIKLGNAGVITATSFVGSGAALTGIDATAIKDSGGNVKIQAQASGAIHSGVSTFQDIDVDGHTNLDNVSVAGVSTFQDIDVDGHTNLDNVSVAGVTTFTGDTTFSGATSAISVDGDIRFTNSSWAGNAGAKLQHHNNYLYITTGASGLYIRDEGSNNWWVFDTNGHFKPVIDSAIDIGTSSVRVRNGYFDTLYGSGANLTSLPAQATIANNANNRVITGGSGVNLNGEVDLVWDGSRMGVLNQAPQNQYFNTLVVGNNSAGDKGITIRTNNTSKGVLAFSDTDSADANRYDGYISYQHSDQSMRFNTGGANERLQITSAGNVTIATNDVALRGAGTLRINSGSTSGALNLDGGSTNHGGEINLLGGSNGGRILFRTGQGSGQQSEKMRLNENGNLGVNETSPQRRFHVTGSAGDGGGAAHFGVAGTNGGNAYIGDTPVVTISTDGNANAGTNDEKALFQVGRGGGGAGATAVTTEHFRVNLGGAVQIGGAVGNNADIDIANTKLTIKQSANNREDGIYLERTGERRGWLMFVGGSGSYNDAFCLSTNQMGTKTDVLAIDRGNRLAKLGGDVIIDSTNNGYGGLRIYDDSSGGYNVNYVGGRSDGNMSHVFKSGGRSQNQSPWTDASGSEIMRVSLSNGLQLQGDTDSALQFHTGDHYKFKTKDRERVHLDNRGVLTAPKLSTKALIFSSCTNKWASSRTITNFVMQFYTGSSGSTYHFMRMISQPDWAFDDVEIRQYRYQYNPSGSDHTVRRYYSYYGSHSEQIVRYNQNGSGTGTGNDNYITKRTDFGPGGSMTIHQASNGGYYRDLYGSDYAISLGAYYGVVLEIKITASVGVYDTGDYPTAYDFYPANYGGQATQSNADNHGGPRGVWFNTKANGTGSGTAPVISSKNSDRGWFTGSNFLDTSL